MEEMREYRGKRLEKDVWIYGSLIIDEDCRHYIGVYISPKDKNQCTYALSGRQFSKTYTRFIGIGFIIVDPKTVGKFTGLKDKNGKKIYEGDIVKNFDYSAREVLFQNGAYGYETEHVGFVSFSENESFNWKNNQSKYIEVIGNIQDNPNLLEEK